MASWVCPVCSTNNEEAIDECMVCSFKRVTTSWVCRVCSTNNDGRSDSCVVCGAERGPMWICPGCSTKNDGYLEKCVVCGTKRANKICTLTPTRVRKYGLGEHVVVPEEFNVIGEYAFKNRTDVYSIVLPDRIKKIEKEAFAGCTNLSSITYNGEMSSIGIRAFADCRSLPVDQRINARYVADDAYYITPPRIPRDETLTTPSPSPVTPDPVAPTPPPAPTPSPRVERTGWDKVKYWCEIARDEAVILWENVTDWIMANEYLSFKIILPLLILVICGFVTTPYTRQFIDSFLPDSQWYVVLLGVLSVLLLVNSLYMAIIDVVYLGFSSLWELKRLLIVIELSKVLAFGLFVLSNDVSIGMSLFLLWQGGVGALLLSIKSYNDGDAENLVVSVLSLVLDMGLMVMIIIKLIAGLIK